MSELLLQNIKQVYHPDWLNHEGPVSIYINDGIIKKIAEGESTPETEVLDCSGLIALPGFVDSHTHLLFAGSREDELYLRANNVSYLEILKQGGGIYRTVEAVRAASEEELLQNGLRFLDVALRQGITTIEIKSGYGLDFETEAKMLRVIRKMNEMHPIDIVLTFLVHSVPKNWKREAYIQTVMEEMIPAFREYANWFDIFLEEGVFSQDETRLLIQRAIDAGYKIGLHANQVYDLGGVRLANEMGVRHVSHLEVLCQEDAVRIIQNPDLYSVFLPGAESFVFSERIGQINQLLDIPERIVLSTDFNPGSSPVLSPTMIMAMAVLRYRLSNPKLLINAFTINPAEMLFLPDRGKIEQGKVADLILLDLDRFEQVPYFGTINMIRHVIKRGKVFDVQPEISKLELT
ncbi:imidazolonepropionase [candidate division KSB1 bacterium]|nr:imidazolonepropionase [candidate division KSB1 bacterium]